MNSNFRPSECNIPCSSYYQDIKSQVCPKQTEQYTNLIKMFDADILQYDSPSPATCQEILNLLSEKVALNKVNISQVTEILSHVSIKFGLDQNLYNQEFYDELPKVCDRLLAKIKLMSSNTVTYNSLINLLSSPEFNKYRNIVHVLNVVFWTLNKFDLPK